MFFVFAGYNWYPSGGAKDFKGIFGTIDLAKDWCIENPHDWCQIAVLTGISDDRDVDCNPEFTIVKSYGRDMGPA